MSDNNIDVRLQSAYKTEQEWINADPILLKGEVAYSSDKGNIYKVGDGVTSWINLPYSNYLTFDDIIGAVNLLEDSNTLDNKDYYFTGVLSINGKLALINNNNLVELKLGGNG